MRRTWATFLNAEFGFFGVLVVTFTHTPLFCGQQSLTCLFFKVLKIVCIAGDLLLRVFFLRPFLMIWFIVGMVGVRL